MSKCLVLLVVALSLLVSANAIAASPENMASKLSALGVNDKRSLRGMKSTDGPADEQRGDLTKIAQKFKAALSKTSIGQKIQAMQLKKIAAREEQVKKLLQEDAPFATLHANKVTPGEYLQATGIKLSELPGANAEILVPAYGKFKRYKQFVQRQTPQKLSVSPTEKESALG